METDALKPGRAAVKDLLTDRLDAAGLQRPKGVSVDGHAMTRRRLEDHLSYMDPENLMTLAEALLDSVTGAHWPSELVVRQMAHALQAPPAGQKRIVTSWLASVEGPMAEAGGWLVELYRFLLRHGRPPLSMDMRQIREQAAGNARRVEMIRGRIDRDVASGEDREWLERYLADQRAARAVVEQGAQRRQEAEGCGE